MLCYPMLSYAMLCYAMLCLSPSLWAGERHLDVLPHGAPVVRLLARHLPLPALLLCQLTAAWRFRRRQSHLAAFSRTFGQRLHGTRFPLNGTGAGPGWLFGGRRLQGHREGGGQQGVSLTARSRSTKRQKIKMASLYTCQKRRLRQCFGEGFGSGSGFNRASGSGSGSRRAKMTHKSRIFFLKFMFWSVGWPLLWAAGFFCNLDILNGGLGIDKLQFLIIKKWNFFFSCNFFSIFGH